jgi:hypothetical protein
MKIRLRQSISQKIQQYPEEKQRAITITQNIAAISSFRYASLASGAHQASTRVEEWKDVPAAKAVK